MEEGVEETDVGSVERKRRSGGGVSEGKWEKGGKVVVREVEATVERRAAAAMAMVVLEEVRAMAAMVEVVQAGVMVAVAMVAVAMAEVAVAEVAVAMTLFLKRNRTKWRLLSCFISIELFLIITLQLQR